MRVSHQLNWSENSVGDWRQLCSAMASSVGRLRADWQVWKKRNFNIGWVNVESLNQSMHLITLKSVKTYRNG